MTRCPVLRRKITSSTYFPPRERENAVSIVSHVSRESVLPSCKYFLDYNHDMYILLGKATLKICDKARLWPCTTTFVQATSVVICEKFDGAAAVTEMASVRFIHLSRNWDSWFIFMRQSREKGLIIMEQVFLIWNFELDIVNVMRHFRKYRWKRSCFINISYILLYYFYAPRIIIQARYILQNKFYLTPFHDFYHFLHSYKRGGLRSKVARSSVDSIVIRSISTNSNRTVFFLIICSKSRTSLKYL